MPTYEYLCKKCGHPFEQFQRITAEPLKKCPKCKGPVKRLISGGGGIIFKGSGFYATDYRSKSYRLGEKKEKEKQEGNKKKPETKSGGSPDKPSSTPPGKSDS